MSDPAQQEALGVRKRKALWEDTEEGQQALNEFPSRPEPAPPRALTNPIDALAAVVLAVYSAAQNESSVYEERGLILV